MFGLLNLNKHAGATSRDVVNRVLRIVHPLKVGHAGTLDPLATGVLVVCIGSATKLIEHVQRMPKSYRGSFLLGRRSASDDTEQEVELLADAPEPSRAEVEAALPALTGEIQQRPPAYSAINVGGRKAYDLARSGAPPELPPRPVTVYSLTVVAYDYPELVLDIECGSGTYVRAIGRDLAASLGTAAVMSALERTAIGPFKVEEAVAPKSLTAENLPGHLLPAALATSALPRLDATPADIEELRHGRFIERAGYKAKDEIAVYDPSGALFALAKKRPSGKLQPVRVFA
ncbi:tRNA pseudouridine synthase B [Pseudobythopirellula maris]|uniref:tRNA pseudouridine synthase B n=1 Tax=Pseudobythopirellula maris TaxID=2527991 RepID=A0A5C5ZN90_9BACT|nr:tRNA pseudouridine(55) synthase TruB [Pseudobythopirellula maris]TWT88311.1 tRNA pseudouridine synthase B [Pseudobythopirellula maris]